MSTKASPAVSLTLWPKDIFAVFLLFGLHEDKKLL